MATVSNFRTEDLLGWGDIDLKEDGKKDAVLHAINHIITRLIWEKKNRPKQFKRGVIIVGMTCRKCGYPFGVQFSSEAYLQIMKLNQTYLAVKGKFADNQIIVDTLEKNKVASVPVIDVFRYGICCQECISKIKNGQIGKP